jgi:V8-like Glu-specific endopeptidase
MIGRTHVLSAGHCIYSHEHGGWARDVLVIPGMHGDYCPVGGAWAKKLSSWRGWTQNGNHDWDMGVIELDRPSGDWSGYFGLATSSCSASINNIRNNTSYPPIAPFNGVTLAHRAGTADSCPNSNILWFNNPSYGGMSGSPVYRYDGEDRFVIGVLSYTTHGGQVTGVVRVTTDRFYSILDIMGR